MTHSFPTRRSSDIARFAIHGRFPDSVGADGGRVRFAGRHAVLCVFRSHADPHVPDHRGVGRTQPRLCGVQVLPVHADGVLADADCLLLFVACGRWLLRPPDMASTEAGRYAASTYFCGLAGSLGLHGDNVSGATRGAGRPTYTDVTGVGG